MAEAVTVAARLRVNGSAAFQAQMIKARGGITGIGKAADKIPAALNKAKLAMAAFGVAGVAAFVGIAKAAIAFESSFAGVRKTVDATERQFAVLSRGLRDLALVIPISVNELNRVAEAAGQLGIQRASIVGFTETMAKLGVTTNLSAQEAATGLARFSNVMGTSQNDFDKLGSALVELGNNFATTEAEILTMAQRLAAAGRIIGLTEGEVLGFATALTSVGIQAEAGGSAFTRVMLDMQKAVKSGGEELDIFARLAGTSVSDFRRSFETDAAGAIKSFIDGLARMRESGANMAPVLEALGFDTLRVRNALLSTTLAKDKFTGALEMGNKAIAENSALNKEAALRFATTASKIEIAKNQLHEMALVIGETWLPAIGSAAEKLGDLIQLLSESARVNKLAKDLQIEMAKATEDVGKQFDRLHKKQVEQIKLVDDMNSTWGKIKGSFTNLFPNQAAREAEETLKSLNIAVETAGTKLKTVKEEAILIGPVFNQLAHNQELVAESAKELTVRLIEEARAFAADTLAIQANMDMWVRTARTNVDNARIRRETSDALQVEKDKLAAMIPLLAAGGFQTRILADETVALKDRIGLAEAAFKAMNQATLDSIAVQKQLQRVQMRTLDQFGAAVAKALTVQHRDARDAAVSSLEEQTQAVRNAEGSMLDALRERVNESRRLYGEARDAATESFDSQMRAHRDRHRSIMADLAKEMDARLAALDVTVQQELGPLQDRLKLITTEGAARVKQQRDAENALKQLDLTNKLQLAQQQGNDAAIARSARALTAFNRKLNIQKVKDALTAEKARLKGQIDSIKKQAVQQRTQIRDEIDTQRDAARDSHRLVEQSLRDQLDTTRRNLEAVFSIEQQHLQERQRQLQIDTRLRIRHLQDQFAATREHFSALLSSESIQAEARKAILTKSQDELVALLQSFNPLWQDAGQSLGESLVNGLRSQEQSMANAVNSIMAILPSSVTSQRGSSVLTQAQKNFIATGGAGGGGGATQRDFELQALQQTSSGNEAAAQVMRQAAERIASQATRALRVGDQVISLQGLLGKIVAVNGDRVDIVTKFGRHDRVSASQFTLTSFQHGGIKQRPGLALVGERGPELVSLPRGSQVFSNQQSTAMMRGRASGGVTLNYHQNAPVYGFLDFEEQVAEAWRKVKQADGFRGI